MIRRTTLMKIPCDWPQSCPNVVCSGKEVSQDLNAAVGYYPFYTSLRGASRRLGFTERLFVGDQERLTKTFQMLS